MRKIILNVAVSLDGLIEGPAGEYDWCFTDQDYGMTAFLQQTDAIFFGRKSFELFKTHDEGIWPDKKRYVFSNTLQKPPVNTVLVNGHIENKIVAIKKEDGKNIWLFGGALLTTALFNVGLIDEMILSVHPIVLGAGKPLFSLASQRHSLVLLHSETYTGGLVQLTYRIK